MAAWVNETEGGEGGGREGRERGRKKEMEYGGWFSGCIFGHFFLLFFARSLYLHFGLQTDKLD